jgi:hypothetical protein
MPKNSDLKCSECGKVVDKKLGLSDCFECNAVTDACESCLEDHMAEAHDEGDED